ncbi:RNase P modulator RnpM [Virgibacillus oceani]|uniref:DNA-binding protein n=1 Tax=Virgibacillus oceani TaxID=1479511 RepID=A0A917H762_9BACI|nr:YlxR family protein [Virgibacillus oceani]GGG68735.1 DNA-binding protein [Virgibacillus oceani]
MVQKRKVPERKCVVTNEMRPKKELIRIVRNKEGEIFVDESGKKNGRGAYLSKEIAVIDKAEKTGILNRHLNGEVDAAIYQKLRQIVDGK